MRGHRQRESCQACESGEVESNQTGCYATHNDSANPPAPFINHIISLHYASYCVSYQTSFPPQLTPAGEPDPYLALGLWRRPADRGPARAQKKKNNNKKKKKIASIYRNKDKAKQRTINNQSIHHTKTFSLNQPSNTMTMALYHFLLLMCISGVSPYPIVESSANYTNSTASEPAKQQTTTLISSAAPGAEHKSFLSLCLISISAAAPAPACCRPTACCLAP